MERRIILACWFLLASTYVAGQDAGSRQALKDAHNAFLHGTPEQRNTLMGDAQYLAYMATAFPPVVPVDPNPDAVDRIQFAMLAIAASVFGSTLILSATLIFCSRRRSDGHTVSLR